MGYKLICSWRTFGEFATLNEALAAVGPALRLCGDVSMWIHDSNGNLVWHRRS